MSVDNHELVDRLLRLHSPKNEGKAALMDGIRSQFIELGHSIVQHTPSTPDQTIAIRKLHEACMAAIAAIACNQESNNE